MILVVIEHQHGALKDINFELLTLAHKLARSRNEEVATVILGSNPVSFIDAVTSFVNKIFVIEDSNLENFNNYLYINYLSKLITEQKPNLILIGHTGQGIDFAPYLASSLNLPIITDIFDAEFSDDKILARRTMYGGKLNAKVLTSAIPAILTVRQGSFEKNLSPITSQAHVERLTLTVDSCELEKSKFLGYTEAPSTGIDITKADVIVAVGRGIKEEKNLALVEEFAQEIGGTLACTRPIIDAGWLPKDRQVGSSGKTVKPKLYIALGISGAFQHISGMKSSELIIAVNKDPEAPIFSVAHYGVVADLFKVLPALAAKIKELKKR
ncbi:MAG: electron transfer flavoprotein subunit alpha/FixB family protein [candidate division WOR-3 bacterium]|nr:electron transfer flavoprotein subunit alpha/FixB family protein [candidate division WOR-3 bacterium]MCX7757502.1 electron transfer flavoprotein subunit alpha/FixB family protein [candidate division WOR-3 bacterium]MDW7987158.1 electron transfer flavoprotein subunit alpha/FixB family protein [candidate division WOR-3 bacterium]